MGCRQAVRHQTLTLTFVGSNPAIPAIYDPLAQSVEQLPFKQWVRSSNLRRVTKKAHTLLGMCFFAVGDLNHSMGQVRWIVSKRQLDAVHSLQTLCMCFAFNGAYIIHWVCFAFKEALTARDFDSAEGLKSRGILYVFPVIQTAPMEQKIRRKPQAIYSELPEFCNFNGIVVFPWARSFHHICSTKIGSNLCRLYKYWIQHLENIPS